MMTDRITGLLRVILLPVVLTACCCISVAATPPNVFRVLVVDSHSSAYAWSNRLGEGFRTALDRAGFRINYDRYELGVCYRTGGMPLKEDVEALRERLINTRYDLIALTGNQAADLFLDGTLTAAQGTPLLVLSYRGRLAPESQRKLNMTGIETPKALAANVRLGMRLLSPKGSIILLASEPDFLRQRLPPEARARVMIWSRKDFSTAELMRRLPEFPKNSILLFDSWRSPEDGYAILPRIRKAFSGVVLGGSDGDIGNGSAGGFIPCGKEQGMLAGAFARRIFEGESAAAIPVRQGALKPLFDYGELARGGFDPDWLPADSVLVNRPPDFFTRNRTGLLYAVPLMMTLLLGGIAVQQYRHRRIRGGNGAEGGDGIPDLRRQRMSELLDDYAYSERMINRSLSRVMFADDFEDAVSEMLAVVGERLAADRCGIFQYTDRDFSRTDLMFEWTRDGIVSQRARLRNFDMGRIPNWTEFLLDKKEIAIPDTANPPAGLEEEAALLRSQEIRSFLGAGIWIEGRLYGFIGIDFIRERRTFADSDLHVVRGMVNLFLLACERFQQRERIADSASFLRQIVDNIAIPIVILDLDYNVVSANPSMEELAEMPVKEIPGRKCFDIICRNSCPPEWCPMRRTLEDARMHRVEVDYRGRRFSVTAQPIFDRHGKMTYILKSEVDISDLSRQKQELQAAMEQAQAANRAKSYFLATVSHELRTPLNAVIGFSELLQSGDVPPEERRDFLRSINFAGTALLNLINDVLDLSKLEADQMNMVFTKTDVAALVAETTSVFRLKAQEKDLSLSVDCSQLKLPIYVDHLRLRQVILNLVGNAIKFTSEGGVAVSAGFAPDGKTGAGTLTIRVADTGIGISPENAAKVFEPFVQDTGTRGTRIYEGSGLGLAISRRMVSRMGGHIDLESTPGVGSIFTVRIEKLRYDREPVRAAALSAAPADFADGNLRGRALLVDDVPLNLKVLQAMLKKLGIDSVCVSSGVEALDLLREDRQFDLILSDQWMPGMDGFEFAKRVAEEEATASIPVIAVTADAQALAGPESPFRDILLKPITRESLKKSIGKFLVGKGGGV